ncbi:hypothetical protein B0H67DRAFT_507130 [Lasiosphaeris hirsuta]|uniref:Protein SQS1 n=1 Tax=Lasiosphaeris hirsuta TaxID=260670 RepID=A0AA40E1R2_9PEZI|nr:hypothetical protein B0H67DRAFT_507130 [Lasiosphaeris hirsuta]
MRNRKGKRPPPPGARAARAHTPVNLTRGRDVSSFNIIRPTNGFTMQEEARNTISHTSLSSHGGILRQRPVMFVSAGFVEPLKDFKSEPAREKTVEELADGDRGVSRGDSGSKAAVEPNLQAAITTEVTLKVEKLSFTNPSPGGMVSSDLKLDNRVQGTVSSELFFFDLNRDKNTNRVESPPINIPSPRSMSENSDSSEEIILFKGRSCNLPVKPDKTADCPGPHGKQPQAVGETELGTRMIETVAAQLYVNPDLSPKLGERSLKHHHDGVGVGTDPNDDDEDAILADYIANMAANSEDDFILHALNSQRELSGYHDVFGVESAHGDGLQLTGLSAKTDEGEEGETPDSGLSDVEAPGSESEQETDSELDDETLARLLDKQERMGISTAQLILFSDSYAITGSGSKDRPSRGPRNSRLSHTNASSFAEAFDDLDLTDWNQPNIRGQAKGRRRKQPPAFNVSDSEIETALKTAWERDRERKKNRKMEREELRAQGLLGKKVNPDDLRVKYQSGMSLDEIKHELVVFLLGPAETIQFPPMDKEARKTLHEIANKFKIKSQSTGKGDQRRPVLYRTKRTVRYADSRMEDAMRHVDDAALWVRRKYFHRIDGKGKSLPRPPGGGGRSGGSGKAATYRDGEIAGASVPELGQENKGRAMLEKMGWSKGMGLGTVDNKGILEPVVQVVKRSKAGLG